MIRERILIRGNRFVRISRAIHAVGKWEGSSRGHKMRITRLSPEAIEWEIRPPGGPWMKGQAGTVFACVRAMEGAAAK